MKIVAYCRVSTNHEEQLESLENQKVFFEEFAKRNNHTLLKVYSDEGISGKDMIKRKSFQTMLADAKLGLFEMVVVKDISRFARNTVDFLTAIRELKKDNIEVQFVSINQTVLGNSEFLLTLFSAMAQEESANLSTRVKFGKKMSAKNGKVPNFIYGYNRIDRFTLEINQEQAEIVRRIYSMYIYDELGCRKIASILNSEAVQSFKNTSWNAKTVRRILSNSLYKGELISKKTEGVDFLSGTRKKLDVMPEYQFDRKEWGIVTEEEFSKAQKILSQRMEKYSNDHPCGRTSSQYPFSTLIRCKHCGYSFSRRTIKRDYGYYVRWVCTGRNIHSSAFCDNATKIKEDELLEAIREYFVGFIKNERDFLKKYKKQMENEYRNDNVQSLRRKYQNEILSLDDKKQKYKNMYISEIITIGELKKKVSDFDKAIFDLQKKILDCESQNSFKEQTVDDVYGKINEMLSCENFSNPALKEIIDYIEVDNEGTVNVILKEYIA